MKKKILVVDDEPEVVEFLRERLKANNFQAISAADGEEGLRMAVQEPPDLIVLDLVMPKKDGFDMLRKLKVNESTKNIPVIVLTAKSETEVIFKTQEHGASDYIIKPYDFSTLLKYINRHIGSSDG